MTTVNFDTLGLETRDIRVYEALYQMENASLRTIAEKTGMNRGTVYEVIKKLSELGLVTFTQKGERRHYNAADPELLQALIRERRDQLHQLELPTAEYIRRLKVTRNGESSYFAHFYEGDEGIASILRDVLQTVANSEKKEYCVVSSRTLSAFLYNNFVTFTRQRIKMGIFARVVADGSPDKQAPLSERRLLRTNGYALSGYMLLYGDKTALISLDEANRLSGIVIDDKGITTMQRTIFEQLWTDSEREK